MDTLTIQVDVKRGLHIILTRRQIKHQVIHTGEDLPDGGKPSTLVPRHAQDVYDVFVAEEVEAREGCAGLVEM